MLYTALFGLVYQVFLVMGSSSTIEYKIKQTVIRRNQQHTGAKDKYQRRDKQIILFLEYLWELLIIHVLLH